MKDSIVRGHMLRLLSDRREEGPLLFGADNQAIAAPGGIDKRDWLHALAELANHDLVRWTGVSPNADAMLGYAEITESGLDVFEGRIMSKITIRFC